MSIKKEKVNEAYENLKNYGTTSIAGVNNVMELMIGLQQNHGMGPDFWYLEGDKLIVKEVIN